MSTPKEKIIITDVPADKLQYYKDLAAKLGGTFNAYKEGDGEYTIIISFPK